MTAIVDAFPELNRVRQFFPLGVQTPSLLTQQQIDHYNQKGYIFPLDVFNAGEIAEYRTYFDTLLPKALDAGWNSYEITNWHKYCAGVWDLVTHSRILDYVQDLLGETLILRHSHFFANANRFTVVRIPTPRKIDIADDAFVQFLHGLHHLRK